MVRKITLLVKKIIFHPALHALFLSYLWESQKLEYQTIKDFSDEPFSTLFGVGFIYGIALMIAYGIHRILSDNTLKSEADLRGALEDMIKEASEYLYLISPYLDPGNVLIESILSAKRRDVRVTMVYNSRQVIKPKVNEELNRLINAGVEVYSHPRLHSKVYVSDHSTIICSLNLVSRSYTDSFEVGIVSTERKMKRESLEYIKKIILASDHCKRTEIGDLPPLEGYCIRSGKSIPFNVSRPVERSEYLTNSTDDKGKYCHLCGEEIETSIKQPLCANCQEMQNVSGFS